MNICIFADARTTHIQRIVPCLAARGARVHVVSNQAVEVPGATVEQFRVPGPSLANPRRWHGRWAAYLRSFMKRFDVVQVHFLHDWGFEPEIMEQGCFMAYAWGSDIVTLPCEARVTPELRATRVAMLRHAAGVAVCGPRFAKLVADFAGIDPASIDLLPMGVDLSVFDPAASKPRASRDGLTVGFFKGFRVVYGPTYLMQAIPTVLKALPETRFRMVGEGVQLDECQALARRHGVESAMTWIDRQPHGKIPGLLAGWDLTVIPSVFEAFGVAALESAAMRVPVVASEVGGLPDTVSDGRTGLLVPPRDPERLAQAIITLLGDDQLRRRMGDAGRKMVEREYNWQVLLDRWMQAYRDALDRTRVMV